MDGWPVLRSEEAERSIAITSIKRRIVIATVKAQPGSLLGRLQMIAHGTSAAVGRRCHAQERDRQWAQEEKAFELVTRQGFSSFRMGFAFLDYSFVINLCLLSNPKLQTTSLIVALILLCNFVLKTLIL